MEQVLEKDLSFQLQGSPWEILPALMSPNLGDGLVSLSQQHKANMREKREVTATQIVWAKAKP